MNQSTTSYIDSTQSGANSSLSMPRPCRILQKYKHSLTFLKSPNNIDFHHNAAHELPRNNIQIEIWKNQTKGIPLVEKENFWKSMQLGDLRHLRKDKSSIISQARRRRRPLCRTQNGGSLYQEEKIRSFGNRRHITN